MPEIYLSVIPRPIMKTNSIHPRAGNVCHIFTLAGREAILPQYLFTIRRNIMKNAARTEAVISKIVKINSELKDANQIKDNYVHSK